MKIVSVKSLTTTKPVRCIDCFVDKGYLQGASGSLP